MEQERIEQNQKRTVALSELADWIKEKYPEEFILQIEFEEEGDKHGEE